ncbi:hypothetical protein HYX08_04060 [Candidatus Woesearchaeota archaeon]|nr:hypothetical protein [Candidatus Woesearchaeota archaeon]
MEYTELCLYVGWCADFESVGEGKLDPKATSGEELRRFLAAAKNVRRFLEPENSNKIKVSDHPSIVRSEADAAKLIEHAESTIPSAKGSFVLSQVVEYDIIFRRTIIFDGYTINQEGEIIECMKRAGYVHKKPDRDLLRISLRDKDCPPGELERLFREGVLEDAIWKNAITHH